MSTASPPKLSRAMVNDLTTACHQHLNGKPPKGLVNGRALAALGLVREARSRGEGPAAWEPTEEGLSLYEEARRTPGTTTRTTPATQARDTAPKRQLRDLGPPDPPARKQAPPDPPRGPNKLALAFPPPAPQTVRMEVLISGERYTVRPVASKGGEDSHRFRFTGPAGEIHYSEQTEHQTSCDCGHAAPCSHVRALAALTIYRPQTRRGG